MKPGLEHPKRDPQGVPSGLRLQKPHRRSLAGLCACLLLSSALAPTAGVQLVVFLPTNGNWNVAANWSSGEVPTPAQSPIILNGSVAVLDDNAGTCANLYVGQGAGPVFKGTLLVRKGASLSVAAMLLGRDFSNFGQVDQMGGDLVVNGYLSIGDAAGGGSGASGEYNLSAGSLILPAADTFVAVGNQGVGRLLVCGSAMLRTPSLFIGNGPGSSGSRMFQWGGAVHVGNFTIGTPATNKCAYTISSGVLQWGGLLQVQDTLVLQGSRFWLQRTNSGGVGLQLTDTATLQFQLDAGGIAPVQMTGSQISIATGTKVVIDASVYSRWSAQPGAFTLIQHDGYAAQDQFTATNITFTGLVDLVPSLVCTTNSVQLVLAAPTNGVSRAHQGLLFEYWELPINPGETPAISAPLSALPDFANGLVITHPVLGKLVNDFDLSARLRDTNFFARFTGYLDVPTNGAYTFYLNSRHGSRLWIDGALVVNNDGAHAVREVSATTNLTAGLHRIQAGYFHNTGTLTFQVKWAGPGWVKQAIPESALFLAARFDQWVFKSSYHNITYDQDMIYNYAPSFIYDETEGLYKIWMCGTGGGGAVGGDHILYKEATSLEGLLRAPPRIALAPSLDPTKFDQVHACDPNVYRVGNLYYLTYSGNTDNTSLPAITRIGMAVSTNGGRTFTRLHDGTHIIENPNTVADAYGDGQSAVVQANDGYYYMIYTDFPGGTNAGCERVIRSPDPAFSPGSFTNLACLDPGLVGNSVDLLYDATNSQFIVVNGLRLSYFDANWNHLRTCSYSNRFAWTLGEGHSLLGDSRKRPICYSPDNVPSLVFAAATTEFPTNTALWAPWVEGDLKYLIVPQSTAPSLARAQLISQGVAFAGDGTGIQDGAMLEVTNSFTVDFWARPTLEANVVAEATSGIPGTWGQRYLAHPELGSLAWADGHAGMGVSVGRNCVQVFEHSGNYLPALLSWQANLDDWTHIAVVYSNKTPSLYINGAFVHSGLTSTQLCVHPSARNFGGSAYGYYAGQAWNYRVWNRPLASAEIHDLATAGVETNLASALIGEWLLDPPLSQATAPGAKALALAVAGRVAGETYACQLLDNAAGRFTLNPDTGLITVLNADLLNFVTNTAVSLTARAIDSRSRNSDRQFSLMVLATNDPPFIAAISNRTLLAGGTFSLSIPASDPDVPPQPLTFSLLSGPGGASLNATSGMFQWRPTLSQVGYQTQVRVKVRDNGIPNLSATQSFQLTVAAPAPPVLRPFAVSNGQFHLVITGDSGPDYTVQAATNLANPIWVGLLTNLSATPPFVFTDPLAPYFTQRYYRVLLGP